MVFSLQKLLAKLPQPPTQKWPEGVWDIEAFSNGSMSLILYTPHGKDYQTPHDQDELYIIVKGEGELIVENAVHVFKTGDVLFVPAGKAHHFQNFSTDIITWAVFWGPKGGEQK